MPHGESFIVGNKKALLQLKKMIEEALEEGESEKYFTPSDGEGYQVIVIKVSEGNTGRFESLEMPYTEQYGEDNNNMYFVNDIGNLEKPYSPVVLLKKEE